MPNIVQLWDFEDGTTQGWALGDYSSLDDTGKVQGTYSVKYYRQGAGDLIASINNVDLSSVTKPMLVLIINDRSGNASVFDQWVRPSIRVVVKESGSGSTLVDNTYMLYYESWHYPKFINIYRIIVTDLSVTSGKIVDIEIYNASSRSSKVYSIQYIDMIAIIDGADYEYNTGIVTFDNDDLTTSLDIPSSDGDLSGITVPKVAISLATPDWDYTNISFEEVDNQGSLKIDSTSDSNKHCNYVERDTAPTTFQKVNIHVWGLSIGAYAGWMEKVAIVFLDDSWNYKRIYLFNIYFTANGVDPRYISSINTTTYGSTVSGSKDINIKIHGNSLEIALWVKYIVGDHTIVSSGSVTMEIFNSDKTTSYGSVSIDLTASNDQTSSYITGLPTDENLVITLSWSITANSRVVVLACPLVKVS